MDAVVPRAGMTVRVITDLITFKVTGAETGGAYSMVETVTQPGGGTPPHRQADTEAFYVLEGTYGFLVEGEQRVLGPGESIAIPVGTVHAFSNVGQTPARMLIVNSPAGLHERFFVEAGDLVDDPANPPAGEPDFARLAAAAQRAGIELL